MTARWPPQSRRPPRGPHSLPSPCAAKRFGAIQRSGSLSLIEVFWKSFKREYAGALVLYRPLRSIDAKLRAYAAWFNAERPHQGLEQRTPDEVHLRRDTRAKCVPLEAVLAVTRFRGDHELPVLSLRRAA